jgi:uncharacterized membrane protein
MSTAETQQKGLGVPRSLALTLIIGGVIGWLAAFALIIERIHVASDPNATLSCDLNVFISCKSVMLTSQAKLFGFPNPIIGLGAFVAPIVVGFGLLAGAKFAAWFWRLFWIGTLLGFTFVVWLFTQSLWAISVLCPYCMVAWAGMIPVFWTLTLYLIKEDILQAPVSMTNFFDRAYSKAWLWILITELIIIFSIIARFWERWPLMFRSFGWI